MSKKNQVNIRISDHDKDRIGKIPGGATAVFRLGFNTIKMYIQGLGCHTCTYISKTGNHTAPPADRSRIPATPPAHGPCCPACPLHSTFGHPAAPAEPLEKRMKEADEWSELTYGVF